MVCGPSFLPIALETLTPGSTWQCLGQGWVEIQKNLQEPQFAKQPSVDHAVSPKMPRQDYMRLSSRTREWHTQAGDHWAAESRVQIQLPPQGTHTASTGNRVLC